MSRRYIRVVDLETTGSAPPAHGVVEIGWQDVELGADGRWTVTGGEGDDAGARYVDPGRAIPPVTQAIHHIDDADVAGAPRFDILAPAVLRPAHPPIALAAHRSAFEQRFCTPALTGGTPWICTWKCALRLWPGSPSFANQVLRYWRRPAGLDQARGLPAHRAFPDAYVTAHHLRDMLAAASPGQLIDWSRLPGLLPRVPTGPDRGRAFADLDETQLARLAASRDADLRYSAEVELARRSGEVETPPDRQPRLI